MSENKEIIPFEATHPGSLISDEIDCSDDLTQKEVARRLDVKASYINEVIKGKRAVNAELALGLEKVFGIKADYWLNLQSQYDLDKARCEKKNIEKLKNIDLWAVISKFVPVKEFEKRNFFNGTLAENIDSVLKIFDCEHVDGIIQKFAENRLEYLYKKSEKLQINEINVFAWSELSKYQAKKQVVGSFRLSNIPVLIKKLNECFYENENTIPRLKELLPNYGIKFLIIDKFDKAPIDGMSFWSDKNPAISITLRHKRIDNLAFTIMHELGHIVAHLFENKNARFIDIDGASKRGELEKEADLFAEGSLIPEALVSTLNKANVNDDELRFLSDDKKINPAILYGRHCFLTGNYCRCTKILNQIN